MKKTFYVLGLMFLLSLAVFAQVKDAGQASGEQASVVTEIEKLNGEAIKLFNAKDYNEALKIAVKVDQLVSKNDLAGNARVTTAFSNAAEIYLVKGKETEAIAVFQKMLEALQAKSVEASVPAAKFTERIGEAYFLKKDYDKAEEFLQKALILREKLNGAESRETAKIIGSLGNLYRQRDKLDKANEYYLKAIYINDKILSREEKTKRQDLSDYNCFLYHKALQEKKLPEVAKQIKDFSDSRKTIGRDEIGKNLIDSGIINGKAISLAKPYYPRNVGRASGFALVKVTINEAGDVIEAKATCGILQFVEAVEEAAKKSKFSPTVLKGQPVRVTGIIVYNFVGR